MKFWIISLFEPTIVDNNRPMRFMSISNALTSKGHDVTFFSNNFRHGDKKFRFDGQHIEIENENARTVFIQSKPYTKNLSYDRIKSHEIYTQNLLAYIETLEEKPDLILCAFPPISTALKVSKWAEKNNVKFVLDIIDPWPDVILRSIPSIIRPFSFPMIAYFRRQVKGILEKSSGVVSISKQYIDWSKTIVPNSTYKTGVFYPAIPLSEVRKKISDNFNRTDPEVLKIVYAGNLGINYDLPCILEAFKLVSARFPNKVSLYIAGMGHYKDLICSTQEEFPNLHYLGRIGYDELMQLYANSDVGLAQYTAGATQSVTYKLFDYLGAGLPVLNSLLSEMSNIIDDYQVGFNNKPGDYTVLAENIANYILNPKTLEAHKIKAIETTQKIGDNSTVYNAFSDFLISL